MINPTRITILAVVSLILGFFLPLSAFAQDAGSLTITLTPPLFQVTQNPGSDWTSNLRLINSNTYDISVSVSIQDFHPDGETGNAVFENTKPASPTDSHLMSGWIEAPQGDITVKHGVTAEIPFTIHVPPNADPGGHYAALLVGTRPQNISGGSGAGISSAISSLIFLRVPGDVVEKGSIRDFYSQNGIVESPDSTFILRFENEGNIHLIPQGMIEITNMWGKSRGKIDINEKSTFGNVLPNSTRKFEFAWHGESNPFEVGRYKAVATIVYGVDGRHTVERTVYFWVVPWKPVLSIIGGLILFFWFITRSIRKYIKKTLLLERERLGIVDTPVTQHTASMKEQVIAAPVRPQVTLSALRRSLADEPVNLRSKQSSGLVEKKTQSIKRGFPAKKFIRRYRSLIIFLFVFVVGCSLIGWYFVEVFQDERAFKVEQIRPK